MTFAKVGPTLSGAPPVLPARGDETKNAAAFEAALDDTKGTLVDDGQTAPSPSSDPPVVAASLSDLVALAARAADRGSAEPLLPSAGAMAMPQAGTSPSAESRGVTGDETFATPQTPAKAMRRGASDDAAATGSPVQPTVAQLASLVAFISDRKISPVPSSATANKGAEINTAAAAGSAPPASGAAMTPLPSSASIAAASTIVAAPTAADAGAAISFDPFATAASASTRRNETADVPRVSGAIPWSNEPAAALASRPPVVEAARADAMLPVDPKSVRLSTHLGFSRGVPASPVSSASVVGRIAASVSDTFAKAAPSGSAGAGQGVDVDAASSGSSREPASDTPIALVRTTGDATSDAVTPEASAMAQASPLIRRVADGVVALASAPASASPETTPLQVAPARTMDLQLAPAGLGTLTVRLHVSGRSLDVSLEASDAGTAAIIDRDRSSLADALAGRDIHLGTLSVTTQDPATQTSTMPNTSAPDKTTPDKTTQGAPHAEGGNDPGFARSGGNGSGPPGQGAGGRQTEARDDRLRRTRRDDAARGSRDDAVLFV